jgi:hypothetical protein
VKLSLRELEQVQLTRSEMAAQIRIFGEIFVPCHFGSSNPFCEKSHIRANLQRCRCHTEKDAKMAQDVNKRVPSKTDHSGDHITIKFGGAEAKVSGFRIAAFTVVLLFLGWFLVI